MFHATDGFDDATWESAPRTPLSECRFVNPKDVEFRGPELEPIRDCGRKDYNACTKARNERMEDAEEIGDLSPGELDDMVNEWLENPQDPLTIPVLFDEERLTPLECRESFSDLIGECIAGEHDPKEAPEWLEHSDPPAAPTAAPSKKTASADAAPASSFAQELDWDAMQAEYESIISQDSDGDLVSINEPQVGLAEIQEAYEVEYVRTDKGNPA